MYICTCVLKLCIDVILYFDHTRISEVNDVIGSNDIVILTRPLSVVNDEHFHPSVICYVHCSSSDLTINSTNTPAQTNGDRKHSFNQVIHRKAISFI